MDTQAVNGALVKRDGLGGAIERHHETATAAAASRAQAAIQARYVMAMQRPRDRDQVRVDLLRECRRPSFAAVARWVRPQGRKEISGWSIRFVEAAIRCMRNINSDVTTLYDDAEKRIVRCSVIDYESAVEWTKEITIEKTKERRDLRDGDVPLGTRKNSYGDTVYLLPATDDEVRVKEAALVSKELRTLGLRMIPGDLLDEAAAVVVETIRSEDAKDPDEAKRKIIDGYAQLGIRPADLVEYMGGKPLDQLTLDDMLELRGVFAAVRDGERWADICAVSPHRAVEGDPKPDERLASVAAKVKARVERQKAKAPTRKPAEPTAHATPIETAATEPPPAERMREPGED